MDGLRLSVILPDTYEAGGDIAALRIKRTLSRELASMFSCKCTMYIGVTGVNRMKSVDLDSIIEELENSLEFEEIIQGVLCSSSGKPGCGVAGKIVVSHTDALPEEVASQLLEENFRIEHFIKDSEPTFKEKIPTVIYLDKSQPLDIKINIVKKIRNNRQLDHIVIIWHKKIMGRFLKRNLMNWWMFFCQTPSQIKTCTGI